ncbi:MAG: hypothetical protein ABI630_02905 [Betaproteobacteria bacterium]
MTVSATNIATFSDRGRQHYRISFKNQCESVRVVYWCAEPASRASGVTAECVQAATPAIAAPHYVVVRTREFQSIYPQGTRIRFVDCADSAFPTSDFRCSAGGQRPR